MTSAPAKVNLALVVGPRRTDGKHEVATVLERLVLADTVTVERDDEGPVRVTGFEDDTIVRAALTALADAAASAAGFRATIEKRIPVAAGLGGGSSDAAAALRQANALLEEPLPVERLLELAAGIGADVPFFLADGPQLGTGDGSTLTRLDLPAGYHVVLWLPEGGEKPSTGAVYADFDARGGEHGFEARHAALLDALARVQTATDLALLPRNDLASSPLTGELEGRGAFRADVTGAGPTLYGLFLDAERARHAADELSTRGRCWVTTPLAPA